VGIRIPDNRICIELVAALGNPIITTSANFSGEEPEGDPRTIAETFGSQLDFVIDGGILATDVSSVVSLIGTVPEVLRTGLGDVSWCGR
jgi:tRNA A37 threonylcarbamoyladenosine synthetase subunit TsaC/SUA5/YrdC